MYIHHHEQIDIPTIFRETVENFQKKKLNFNWTENKIKADVFEAIAVEGKKIYTIQTIDNFKKKKV